MYQNIPSYTRLVFADKVFDKTTSSQNKTVSNINRRALKGTPCSHGVVECEVLLVDNPQDVEDTDGKILVTKTTDPGWVFLMVAAKGVIAEKGSLLSHTAIISRELNVPVIVGVEKVTSILKSGDTVRMDANKGTIKVIS